MLPHKWQMPRSVRSRESSAYLKESHRNTKQIQLSNKKRKKGCILL